MLAGWTQGCTAYRPAPLGTPLPEWRQVHLRSAEPFPLKVATSASTLVTACRATDVEGRVRRVAGDTLVLRTSGEVTVAPEADGQAGSCPGSADVTIVLTPAMALEAREVEAGPTAGLVVGLALAAGSLFLYHLGARRGPIVFMR